jgi:hypothetical protein
MTRPVLTSMYLYLVFACDESSLTESILCHGRHAMCIRNQFTSHTSFLSRELKSFDNVNRVTNDVRFEFKC